MSLIDPIAIAVIATATDGLERPPPDHIQRERRFRENLRQYPPGTVLDIPFCRLFHREFYLSDPYLDVAFEERGDPFGGPPGGWCMGRFMHDPLGLGEPYEYRVDALVLRDHNNGRRFYPSPALLKAIRRVLDESQ